MTETLKQLVDRYVRAWNDPDVERRRKELEDIYAPDSSLVTQTAAFDGVEAVIEHVGEVFDEFIGSGRFVFRTGGLAGHHHCVLFRWEMVDALSGQVADAGMNTFLLAPDGRIGGDYQFVLGVDSSIGSMAARES